MHSIQVDCNIKAGSDLPLYSTDTNAKVLSTSKINTFNKFILNPNAESFIPRGDISMVNVLQCNSINQSSDINFNLDICSPPQPVTLNPDALHLCPNVKSGIINIQCTPVESDPNKQEVSDTLHQLRLSNVNKISIGHLNINSLRNKFEMLTDIVKGAIDILIISETKLDESFPQPQFYIDGYSKPFRLDRNSRGGGVIAFIREDIPCKRLFLPNINIEAIFFEINLRKTKWLCCGGYNNHNKNISSYIKALGDHIDTFIKDYDNLLILGDFNAEANDPYMETFCETYKLKHLVKEPTCFKNPLNPKCIDIILTNRFHNFQNTNILETGLSDHHKLTLTILKNEFVKSAPNIIKFRNIKAIDNVRFKTDLVKDLSKYDADNITYEIFHNVFMDLTDKHAPIKTKYLRANHAPFMSKFLLSNISHRTKLRNKFLKNPTPTNKTAYKTQRNKCVKILRNEKRSYYENLNPNILSDNKKFWKMVKPFFSEKSSIKQKVILIENNEILNNDQKVAETLNIFFTDVVKRLGTENEFCPLPIEDDSTDISTIIKDYSKHPSILQIKESFKILPNSFNLDRIRNADILTAINKIDISKNGGIYDIPTKLLKMNSDIIFEPICAAYNNSLTSQTFPSKLKMADITPVHKKGESTNKENYRPVSILPVISKLFEKTMYCQIYTYINQYLSHKLCGFRKGLNSQYALIYMLESWKKSLDGNGNGAALLTDLSKAFDCLNHNLLIAKLHAYGFDDSSLNYILSYLRGRKHRTKVGIYYSSWKKIILGVPQGSILGPLLFNIYINDLFLSLKNSELANYADDNTPFACKSRLDQVITQLEDDFCELSEWFRINCLTVNNDKCHLLVSNHISDVHIKVGTNNITCSASEKFLGVTIDNTLKFDKHVSSLCKRANQKFHALARMSNYVSSSKLKTLMKAFVISQFSYCPLVWMFHGKHMNNKINHIHERALRLVYNDYSTSFESLLEKDQSFTIHERNLQSLAIEMFKLKNEISPKIMQDLFPLREKSYNTRGDNIFKTSNVKTVYYGTETLLFRGPKTWSLVPPDIRKSTSLEIFKKNIKKWKPIGCTCRICKPFVKDLGFI